MKSFERESFNFKKKPDKRMSLEKAVETFLFDGDSVVFGGMGGSQCVAHTYEIIRQNIKNLTLIADSPCESGDMLIGAGLVKRAELAWCGYAVAGLASNYRRVIEKKIPHDMELEEYSNYGMGLRLLAGALNIPLMPVHSYYGSDLPIYNENIKMITDPYSGDEVYVVPAVCPDVAFVHCSRADMRGNAQIFGFSSNAENAVRAAKYAVVTCEQIVTTEEIRQYPNLTVIPEYIVDAVIEVPYASHPWNLPYNYAYDLTFHTAQMEAFRTREGFLGWLKEWCFDAGSWGGYLDKVGHKRLQQLSKVERRFTKSYF